jgi:hypothetical protein
MSEPQKKTVAEAFDGLLDAIEESVALKFQKLEAQVKEKRIATLKADLAELEKRNKTE